MAQTKPIAEQMAALNNSDDTSFAADRSNSLLNATCPARIQNSVDQRKINRSFNDSLSSGYSGKWLRPKREALKITPLAQIDEAPATKRHSSAKDKHTEYKTRLCDAFRREGYCPYNDNCTYAHGQDELRVPRRRQEYYSRDPPRERRDSRSRRDDVDTTINRSSSSASKHHDENRRPSNNHGSSNRRQICHNFERGNCRYGPRCRFIHVEQMQHFNANATVYAPPSSDCPPPIAYYHHHPQHQQQFLPFPMPYFLAPPPQAQQGAPFPVQYIPQQHDLMNSQPIYAPMAPTYYYQPINSNGMPMMDVTIDPNATGGAFEVFPDGFFSQPPPTIIS